MNLRTYLLGSNLWAEIETIGSFAFIQDATQMDFIQVIEYGEREMFAAFDSVDIPTIAGLIVTHFGDKWETILNSHISSLDITSEYTKKTDSTIAIEELKNGTDDSENKVSAFNSDVLITDTGNGSTRTEDINRDTSTEKVETMGSFKDLFNNLSTIEQSNIINIAIEDVAKYLTISIY